MIPISKEPLFNVAACKEFFCLRFPYFSSLNILNLLSGCNLISTTRIIRNASLLGVAQAVSMAAGFISTAWIARALGPEGYGVLGFAVAFGSYFALATVFGTDLFGTREIASAPDRAHTLVSRILGTRILLLVCAVFLYLLSVWIIDRSQDVTIVLLIQIIVLISSAITIDFLFQAHQRMGPIALRQMGAAMAAMIAVVFLVQSHNDLYIAAAIPCSAMLISAVFLALFADRRIERLRISFSRTGIKDVLISSAPIMLSGVMSTVLLNVDVVMLGFIRTAEEVGIYAGMARLFVLSTFAAHIISAAFAPALAAESDKEDRRRIYYRYIRILIFIGAPLSAAIVAFPEWLVILVFGAGYLEGARILALLGFAAVLSHLTIAPLTALIAWRDQTAQMIILTAVAISNVALNFCLIPIYGGIGAGIATLIAQALMLGLLVYRVRSKFGFFGFAPAAGAIGCAGVAFIVVIFAAKLLSGADGFSSDWTLPLLMVFAGSGIYIGFTLFFGVVRRGDVIALTYVLRNRDSDSRNLNETDRTDGD